MTLAIMVNYALLISIAAALSEALRIDTDGGGAPMSLYEAPKTRSGTRHESQPANANFLFLELRRWLYLFDYCMRSNESNKIVRHKLRVGMPPQGGEGQGRLCRPLSSPQGHSSRPMTEKEEEAATSTSKGARNPSGMSCLQTARWEGRCAKLIK